MKVEHEVHITFVYRNGDWHAKIPKAPGDGPQKGKGKHNYIFLGRGDLNDAIKRFYSMMATMRGW